MSVSSRVQWALVLTMSVVCGESFAGAPAPKIVYHEGTRSKIQLINNCRAYLKKEDLPCVVIQLPSSESVCYAYLEYTKTFTVVHCYKEVKPWSV